MHLESMQGEQTFTEASCLGRNISFRGDSDTVEILIAAGSPTDYQMHQDAIEVAFSPYEVQTKSLDNDVEASASSTDVLIIPCAGRRSVDLGSLRAQNPGCCVLGIAEERSSVEVAHSSFDAVLGRPVSSTDLVDAVDRLLRRRTYDQLVTAHLKIASELTILETDNTVARFTADDRYTALLEEMAAVESECAALAEELDALDFDMLFRRVER